MLLTLLYGVILSIQCHPLPNLSSSDFSVSPSIQLTVSTFVCNVLEFSKASEFELDLVYFSKMSTGEVICAHLYCLRLRLRLCLCLCLHKVFLLSHRFFQRLAKNDNFNTVLTLILLR